MGTIDGPGSAGGGEATEAAVGKLNRAERGVGDIRGRTARNQRDADADAQRCGCIRLRQVLQRRRRVLRAQCAGQERREG